MLLRVTTDDNKLFLSLGCHMLLPIFSPFIFGLWETWASNYITNRKFWITNRSGPGLAKSLSSDTSLLHHEERDVDFANPWMRRVHSTGNPNLSAEGKLFALLFVIWKEFKLYAFLNQVRIRTQLSAKQRMAKGIQYKTILLMILKGIFFKLNILPSVF